jgi:hypothetical protein
LYRNSFARHKITSKAKRICTEIVPPGSELKQLLEHFHQIQNINSFARIRKLTARETSPPDSEI